MVGEGVAGGVVGGGVVGGCGGNGRGGGGGGGDGGRGGIPKPLHEGRDRSFCAMSSSGSIEELCSASRRAA